MKGKGQNQPGNIIRKSPEGAKVPSVSEGVQR